MTATPNSFKSLKNYSKEPLTADEFKQFIQELMGESHRGAALVASSMLESHLASAIKSEFQHLDESEIDEIVGQNGLVNSFSGKIKIAYALKLITKEMRDDMNVIREIRNAFAHSQKPLNFDIKQISSMCHRLMTIEFEKGFDRSNVKQVPNRNLYLGCALNLAVILTKTRDKALRSRLLARALLEPMTQSSTS